MAFLRSMLLITAILLSAMVFYSLNVLQPRIMNERLSGLVNSRMTNKLAGSRAPTHRTPHPIELLVNHFEAEHRAMLSRQSKTLRAATREYRRRYKRDPPPGFSKWYEYAVAHGSQIIDDYDDLNDALEPLRQVPRSVLRSNVETASQLQQRMFACGYVNGTFHYHEDSGIGHDLYNLMGQLKLDIPDFLFIVNDLDEPRQIISSRKQVAESLEVTTTDLSHSSIHPKIREYCDNRDRSKDPGRQNIDLESPLPFVQNVRQWKDVCLNPEYEISHGFVISPSTMWVTGQAMPILSQAGFVGFSDILFPAPYYLRDFEQEADIFPEADQDHTTWAHKKNDLYWSGSNTGAFNTDDKWRQGHRQRFVEKVRHLKNNFTMYLRPDEDGHWERYAANDEASYDVHFSQIVQCEEKQCDEQTKYFGVHQHQDFKEQYRHRFLIDLDGNSYSGRFMTQLRSQATVLKMSQFKEWFDERLVPWVHYVPVSLSMEELPEIMRYLSLTPEGEQIAQKIALQGRRWAHSVLRKQDFRIYWYRLMLELGRLMTEE